MARTIAVIRTGAYDRVLNRTINTREWEGYAENAAAVSGALKRLGFRAQTLPDGVRLPADLQSLRPDLVWICSGGIQGHDPATHLPGLLEMLGLPYVGARPLAAGRCDNKGVAKQVARRIGIPSPDFKIIPEKVALAEALAEHPPFPLVVKPVCGMCSCGVYRVDDESTLKTRIVALRERYASDVLIESFVGGLDLSVSCLETEKTLQLFPVLQRSFQSIDDPDDGSCVLQHPESTMREGVAVPVVLDDAILCELHDYARQLFREFRLRHYARIDFRVDGSEINLLEVTHKPDLTERSVYARSAALGGLDYDALIERIVQIAFLSS